MGSTYYIPLDRTPEGLRLRELDGHAELAAVDSSTPSVLGWLDRLLDGPPAESIAVSDRDRLLAAIYRREFGDRIDSTITCTGCGQPFDLSFSLQGLVNHLYDVQPAAAATTDGVYWLPDGSCFRLPTGADELAIANSPFLQREQQLLERCIVGEKKIDPKEMEAAISSVAPLLSTELAAQCPECGKEQPLQFDIQSLLFHRLAKERREVTRQVHLLASTYKWGREEILRLSREERRTYSALIEYERQ